MELNFEFVTGACVNRRRRFVVLGEGLFCLAAEGLDGARSHGDGDDVFCYVELLEWFFECGARPGCGDGAVGEGEGCISFCILMIDESDDEVVLVVFGRFEVFEGYALPIESDEALVLVGG